MIAFPIPGGEKTPARPLRAFSVAALAGLTGIAALAGSSVPAQAQLFGWWNAPTYYEEYYDVPRAIGRGEIRRMMRSRGLRIEGAIRRNGRVYLVDVRTRWGDRRRLIVDRYRGEIVQSFPLRRRNATRPVEPFGHSGPPRPPGRIAGPNRGSDPDGPVIMRPERAKPVPRVVRRPDRESDRKLDRKPIVSRPLEPAKPAKPAQPVKPDVREAARPDSGNVAKPDTANTTSRPDHAPVSASAGLDGVRGRAVPLPPAKPEGLASKSNGAKPSVARVKPDGKAAGPAAVPPGRKAGKPDAQPKKKPVRKAVRSAPDEKKETLRQMVPRPAEPSPVRVPVQKKQAPAYVKRYKGNKPRVVYPGPGADPTKGPPEKAN